MSPRQLEPRAISQPRPVRFAALTATIQGGDPLTLYLVPYPAELALTVMQREVLIEATQHLRQMQLLLPSSPMTVLHNPLVCASQELPTTLRAGSPDESETPRPIHPGNMFEAQKLESLRPSLSVSLSRDCREAPEEYAPSLLLGQLQPKGSEPLLHLRLESVRRACVITDSAHDPIFP